MKFKNTILLFFLSICVQLLSGQIANNQNNFWREVQFGGGLGLGFSNGGFNASVAPSAIYNFNDQFATGISLNFNYAKFNEDKLLAYGGSILSLYNPIPQIQLSAELEQLRIKRTLSAMPNNIEDNYWSPSLFFGIGYRTRNLTMGIRYNVLHDERKSIYADALLPFVRVFF